LHLLHTFRLVQSPETDHYARAIVNSVSLLFQHCHILLIMDDADKPRDPEDVDHVVSAEIPDETVGTGAPSELHQLVLKHMIHGPCSNRNPDCVCMVKEGTVRRCSKNFPKDLRETTMLADTTYPAYRRRSPEQGGNTGTVRVRGQAMTVENDFVVPYNPYLLLKYRAHINVEVVASIEAVKYLYKYITKGTDRVMVRFTDGQMHEIRNPNEVEHYQNTRYLSASEALSRIYDYAIVHKYPPVELLDVHLEDEQGVFFTEHTAETVADRGPPRTKLTEYFDLNLRDAAARDILYPDIYRHYTWDKAKRWKPRLRTMHIPTGAVPDYGDKSEKIGRFPVLSLSVHTEERYFLRMLLYNKPGATSFADLRTVDGDEQATFKDACLKIGLLETDRELDWVMEEAALMSFGSALIAVFATMLIFLQPTKALEFWERHRNALCQHLMIRDRLAEPKPAMVNDVLLELRDHLQRHGLHPTDNNYPLPPPDENQRTVADEREIREETDFDLPTLQLSLDEHLRNMTAEQRRVYDRVVGSVRNNRGLIIALDAPGGSGKSYVLEAILAYVRLQGNVALATATTGIAATLLPNGRTMHSRCKVPINITAESTCSVTRRDRTGKLIIESKLFVCDEVTSAPRYCFEAVDRSFQDLREDRRPFGGMTTVLCGDWRQILPVVRRGSPADILDACLKSSRLWRHVQVEHLRRNMRVELSGAADNQFTDHLLDIGDG
jgi:hypothetical protein